jgi:hypothetical protein
MGQSGRWVLGGLIGASGLIGLFFAASGRSQGLHDAGVVFFVFSVLFVFGMIKRGYDRLDESRR